MYVEKSTGREMGVEDHKEEDEETTAARNHQISLCDTCEQRAAAKIGTRSFSRPLSHRTALYERFSICLISPPPTPLPSAFSVLTLWWPKGDDCPILY